MKTNGIKPIDPDLDSTNHRSRGQRSEDELSAVSTSKTFFLEIYYFMMMRFHFMLKVVFTVQCFLDGILNCYTMLQYCFIVYLLNKDCSEKTRQTKCSKYVVDENVYKNNSYLCFFFYFFWESEHFFGLIYSVVTLVMTFLKETTRSYI